ncbi:5-formyltetrahydrofolate cyclo-ligase [Isosphaeraceae bacterium EP7]
MDNRTRKRRLRREVRARILATAPARRLEEEAELALRFETLPGLSSARTVLLYVRAFREEIDTRPMVASALERNLIVACPRVDAAGQRLRLFRIADPDRDLVPGTLNIPEPAATCPELSPKAIDWVLVPGLAFDPRGYRLGRGGGYYDRLLPELRPDAPRWALAFDAQWVEGLPVEPHDMPLDGIVSPSRTETPA